MRHKNTVEFKVYGDYGMFADPLTRIGGEKFSYQIPTYEALKGILHSIYWKPTIIWYIDELRILNPIQTEAKGVRPIKYESLSNELSYYTYLKNCSYQVRAHFEWNLNRPELQKDRDENKHHNIALRMIDRGGRRDIFLGSRECQGYVEPCRFGDEAGIYDDLPELAFGLMYHGITYPDESYSEETKGFMSARFWQPVMKNGIVRFLRPEACPVHKKIRPMGIKPFGKDFENFTGLEEFKEVSE